MVTKKKKKPAAAKGLAVGQSGANQWGKARAARKQRAVRSKPSKGSGVATSSSRRAVSARAARPKSPIGPPSDNKLNAMRKRAARKGPAKSELGARNLPLSKKK